MAFLTLIPQFIRRRIEHRSDLLRIIENIGWLFLDKAIRLGVGMLVGVWVARYLGPEQFGIFNYTTAFVALFAPITALGLNGIVVRDLIRDPTSARTILGTSFFLQLTSGSISFFAAIAIINLTRPTETLVKTLVVILSLTMIFKATDTIKYWFESRVESKYVVWAENATFLFVATIKIFLIISGAPLIAFAWTTFAESALAAAALLSIYIWRHSDLHSWHFRKQRAKQLLKDSFPLIISSTLVSLNLNVDKLLLGYFSTSTQIGIYAAANILVTTWFFVPVALGGSIAPKMTALYTRDRAIYLQNTRLLYTLFKMASTAVSLLIFIFSEAIISLLYGNNYATASDVLSINIWSIVFISLVSLRGRLLIIESKQTHLALLVFFGSISNLTLGLFLIPQFGAIGAAWASLLSWAMNALVFPLFFRHLRYHAILAATIYGKNQ